jgi:hypothetical protein
VSSYRLKISTGKESAYMLFYRRKCLDEMLDKCNIRPPVWLINEINERNAELNRQRSLYEKQENEVHMSIYLDLDFSIDNQRDKLLLLNEQNNHVSLGVDKRVLVKNLASLIIDHCSRKDKCPVGSKEGMFFFVLFSNHFG